MSKVSNELSSRSRLRLSFFFSVDIVPRWYQGRSNSLELCLAHQEQTPKTVLEDKKKDIFLSPNPISCQSFSPGSPMEANAQKKDLKHDMSSRKKMFLRHQRQRLDGTGNPAGRTSSMGNEIHRVAFTFVFPMATQSVNKERNVPVHRKILPASFERDRLYQVRPIVTTGVPAVL